MDSRYVLLQLIAIRAQVDALVMAMEGQASEEQPVCRHASEPENLGTFGAPDWRCPDCRRSVPAPERKRSA